MSTPVYVATAACGCVVAACVDRPRHRKDTAEDVAGWIADGLTVARKDDDGQPGSLWERCPEHANLSTEAWVSVIQSRKARADGGGRE